MIKVLAFVAAVTVCCCTTAWSVDLSADYQNKLIKSVDSYARRMSEVALKIWSAPELGYQETKTSALLQDELKRLVLKWNPVSLAFPLRSLLEAVRVTVP